MENYKEKNLSGEFYKAVLDRLDFGVHVTDADTGEILYANRSDAVEGQFFKEFTRAMTWNGRRYEVHDVFDVTEYEQGREHSDIDELTGVMSRRLGKAKLAQILAEAKASNTILVIALCDMNDLKEINDSYGYHEGNHLISYLAHILQKNIHGSDLVFRLSGDEFVVLFYDCDLYRGQKRMHEIKAQFEKERGENAVFYEASFSFGLLDIYPGDHYNVSDILSLADEQMYIQKRNYHIIKANERLYGSRRGSSITTAAFEYDKDHLYDALMASTESYLFVGNMKTGTFRYPPAMVEEFGLPGQIVENAAAFWGKLIHPHDKKLFLESNQDIADGRADHHSIEYRAKNVRGEWVWLRCRGKMIRDLRGTPELFAGMITNLGLRNKIDHMTGLYNRFGFEGDIKKFIVDCQSGGSLCVIIIDMDAFKNINDLYDRSFGDDVLRLTGQWIASMLPSGAKIYRLDGDEFGIVMQGAGKDDALSIFGRIQNHFSRQQEINGRKYYCTLSGGCAFFPKDAADYQEIIKYANYSLEIAKVSGKNRLVIFSESILQTKEKNLELTEMLREGIERGFAGFIVHYQPQVDACTGRLVGAEALTRFHCAKFGDVPPDTFIPLLERSGLIIPLGNWVFKQAAAQCGVWRKSVPDFHMSINLSYLQLLESGDIVGDMCKVLDKLEVPPSSIVMELTESYMMKSDASIRTIIEAMRKTGMRIAMDDFGTGYSSLLALKNTPVDIVKIDRGFVYGMMNDLFTATFIQAITDLCKDTGKIVCQEGVETKEEYEVIKRMGIDMIQGYYFGKPMPEAAFAEQFIFKK